MRLRYYALATLLAMLGVVGLVRSSPLMGVFPVTPAYSLGHLVSGACAAFAASRGLGAMRAWGKILGFSYAASAAAGFLVGDSAIAWLHVGLALVFLYHALLAPPTL